MSEQPDQSAGAMKARALWSNIRCFVASKPTNEKGWPKYTGDEAIELQIMERKYKAHTTPQLVYQEGPDSMRDIYNNVKNWSVETFGDETEKGPVGPLRHLKKECDEAIADPSDIMEFADLLILVMDASWRAGHSLGALRRATLQKIEVLKTREYKRVPEGEISEHNRALD